ncbi:MAG: AAA family ATPase [Bacteroidetes bacterium]|nr:AAA family ATPase [Bacteroidota bacterium]
MRIETLTIKNFKGFEEISVPLNPNFNLIIGDNGSGKSAILEALTIAMGSFFLGINGTDSRSIREADVRLRAFDDSQEKQFPVEITASGQVNNKTINWTREQIKENGSTLSTRAKEIKKIAEQLDKQVRNGEPITMPVFAYYSTGRLWKDLVERKTNKEPKQVIASRFRAYKSCLQATSTFKIFMKWYKGKEISAIQKREEDYALKVIKNLIISNLPNCKNLYYEFDEDKIQGIKIEQENGKTLPFEYLSDGTRNLFAMLADIAYKCLVLNPHLKENALTESNGIVLIDELDLHLHPEWQKQIIVSLKRAFPNIQFIASTHSPFLIQEAEEGQLLKLKDNNIEVSGGDQLSIEDIAQSKQEVENPQWSEKKKELYVAAEEYYKALENGEIDESLELKVAELMQPFSQNQAYDAFMNQIRLTKESDNEASK